MLAQPVILIHHVRWPAENCKADMITRAVLWPNDGIKTDKTENISVLDFKCVSV